MNILTKFANELQRRRVFSTATIYIVAAWLVVQVADTAFPGMNIPEEAIRYVWIAAILGLPIAVIFGWKFDISTKGIKRTPPADSADPADLTLRAADYAVLGSLSLVSVAIIIFMSMEISRVEPTDDYAQISRDVLENSLAVLPLANLTGDPDQDYLVDALHDALITDLSRISALRVISRTSTLMFKTIEKSLPEIGSELGVARIIEGSVFRDSDRVRVTVQLINAKTDEHIWAENYERDIKDIFSLQGEIVRAIARRVQGVLAPEDEERLRKIQQRNPEVDEAYLRGMYHLKKYTRRGIQRGMRYLREAVENNPANAKAWAGLALGYNAIGHGTGADAFPQALHAAGQALKLDEYSGEAWAALAEAQLYYDYDWLESEKSFKKAIQLSPSLDDAHAHYAYLLALFGRWDEVYAETELTRQLSPLDPTWAFFSSWLYMLDSRYEEAYSHINDAFELAPGMAHGLYGLGQLYSSQGLFDKAIEAHEQIPEGRAVRNWALGPSYAMAGRREDALEIAEKLRESGGPKDKLHVAFVYAGLGDHDEAIRVLEECYDSRVDWLPWIVNTNAYGGVLENLRDDPRFQDLVQKLNLPRF
jgi:TolB-like protein/Flp pilus assembly protein TadD